MSSSDSDDLESFLDSLRRKKPQTKSSSSEDSMEDFIVDDDHVSFCEDEKEPDPEDGERREDSSDADDLNTAISNLTISPRKSEELSPQKGSETPNLKSPTGTTNARKSTLYTTPLPHRVGELKGGFNSSKKISFTPKSTTAKRSTNKSARTPKIQFSSSESDEENEVFWTPVPEMKGVNSLDSPDLEQENSAPKSDFKDDHKTSTQSGKLPSSSRSSVKKTSRVILISDDSSSDEDFDLYPGVGLGKDLDENHSDVFQSPVDKPVCVISSDSEDSYTPLVGRVRGDSGRSVLKDSRVHNPNMPKRKSSEPKSTSRPFCTPAKPPPKTCFSEKVTKSKTVVKKRSDGLPPGLPPNSGTGAGFKRHREVVTKMLYDYFNETVFDSRLPKDMIVEWSKRLLKTAGITKCQRQTMTTTENGIKSVSKVYKATISLSEKVLDTLPRTRDTLCHEMCHAAVWLLDNQSDGHGPFWKSWARKAMTAHPDMPMIKRCHSYDITYKYSYQCTQCRKVYGRHSKSIKVDKQACGICRGRLVFVPPTNSDGSAAKTRQPGKFAMFVKEHYRSTSATLSTGSATPKHADVMKALSQKFSSLSTSK